MVFALFITDWNPTQGIVFPGSPIPQFPYIYKVGTSLPTFLIFWVVGAAVILNSISGNYSVVLTLILMINVISIAGITSESCIALTNRAVSDIRLILIFGHINFASKFLRVMCGWLADWWKMLGFPFGIMFILFGEETLKLRPPNKYLAAGFVFSYLWFLSKGAQVRDLFALVCLTRLFISLNVMWLLSNINSDLKLSRKSTFLLVISSINFFVLYVAVIGRNVLTEFF